MATCIQIDKQQPNVQTHTLHTVTLTYIGKSAWGGRGPAPNPHPRRSQAKPCCQAAPTGSPCISRCHLNAYGHLYLSPSTPHPRGSQAKPSHGANPPKITMLFYATCKCIWQHVWKQTSATPKCSAQMLLLKPRFLNLEFCEKICLKIALVSS